MAQSNLNIDSNLISIGKDAIVVQQALADLPGGRTLNVSDASLSDLTVIQAGHVIQMNDTTGECSPLGLTTSGDDTVYGTVAEGCSLVGVLKASVMKADPRAAIVTMGQVNAAACPYPITETIKNALTHINFI